MNDNKLVILLKAAKVAETDPYVEVNCAVRVATYIVVDFQ